MFKIGNVSNKIIQLLSLEIQANQTDIYCSDGLLKHIQKRHPDCVQYFSFIPEIIATPDYIGINPNENDISFELVKILDNNLMLGIKLDRNNDYFYVATLHTITDSKLSYRVKSGRLKKNF